MIKRRFLTAILTLGLLVGTFGTSGMAMAQGYYYNYPPRHESHAAHQTKRAIEYGLFGAGAGYVLSGHNHRGTNVLKGAAIGSAAGLLTGR